MAMTCATHNDRNAVAYCRNCGKAMCPDCVRDVRGMIYCEPCLVERVQAQAAAAPAAVPYSAATESGPSPALAAMLGFIPGVGAIYNGQFAKAFFHVVVFGMLVSLADSHMVHPFQPLFGFGVAFWIFYMVGDAYHTAKRRRMGLSVNEWSGLLGQSSRLQGSAGALLLIGLGVVFLLDTMNVVPIAQIVRYWPVVLIAAGVAMLYQRAAARPSRRDSDTDDLSISRPPEP